MTSAFQASTGMRPSKVRGYYGIYGPATCEGSTHCHPTNNTQQITYLHHYCFRQWLDDCNVPSHALRWCWFIINWTQRNDNVSNTVFRQNQMPFKMSSTISNHVCSGLDGLWSYHLSCVCHKETYKTMSPGPRLNIKTILSTYGDFHVKDKTAVRTSYL